MLHGGVANTGAVTRRGDVVYRPSNPHTSSVHWLLSSLRHAGFDGVPEPLGVAPDGRERLRFIPGDVPCQPYPAWSLTEHALGSAAALLRRFHDAQAGLVVPPSASWSDEMANAAGSPVICHNDVCPENVVFRNGEAVALLDFDFAAPGGPLYDLAQFAKMWVPLDCEEAAARSGRAGLDPLDRLGVIADAYGLPADRGEFLDVLEQSIEAARTGWFVRRQIERGHAAFIEMADSMGGLERYERRYRWFVDNRQRIADALG